MAHSHTELSTFRRCQREHYYNYRLRRVSKRGAESLQAGKRVHKAVGQFHRGEVVDFAPLKPAERAMVKAYMVVWKDTLRTEKTDVPFRVRVKGVELIGEIDLVAFDVKKNRRVIVEHKTTREDISPGSSYWKRIVQTDGQVSIYLYAAREWGDAFLIYDAMLKPLLRQKAGESDDDFEARCLEDIAKRPEHYFQRSELVRTEQEHALFERDTVGTVHLMQLVDGMRLAGAGVPPRNTDSCFKFGRPCDYLGVCLEEENIDGNGFMDKPRHSSNGQTEATESGGVRTGGDRQDELGSAAPKAHSYRF